MSEGVKRKRKGIMIKDPVIEEAFDDFDKAMKLGKYEQVQDVSLDEYEKAGTGSPASGLAAVIFLPLLVSGFVLQWLGIIV